MLGVVLGAATAQVAAAPHYYCDEGQSCWGLVKAPAGI
jgi:hypothetical protein